MGFRDLRSFNLAMLAKQGWRMIQEQNSLLSRCFKAKYFPRCSFMEAADCPNNSYVWKSVLAGQQILKKGSYWRVGTGSSIWVMEDKWILNYLGNKILFPTEYDEWEGRVSDLIDWRVWDIAPPARFIGCWAKSTWMGGVVLLPLKMEVRLIIFPPLD